MAELSNKKRKRDVNAAAKSKKKVVIDVPPSAASISSVLRPKHCVPVIATCPGIEVPKGVVFNSYVSQNESKTKTKTPKLAANQALLLHSTSHHSLNYIAKEEEFRDSKPLLNHFVGIYDPTTGDLQVVEAKKMVVRGSVRAKQAPGSTIDGQDARTSMMEQKTELGQTFGTKKAKKVIQERVLNAIGPQRKEGDAPTKIDDAARAMLSSVGAITSKMATREELQAVVDEAKPIPRPNVDAKEIQNVYDPNEIIGADILNLVPIREWQEKAQHGENIQTPSRFVAGRVTPMALNEAALLRLRVLRYYSFVLLFYLKSKPGRQRGMRQLPPRDKLREMLAPAPEAVIENIRRKFSDAGTMRKFHIDLLAAHCCVYACIVDNFEVDTQALRDDLRIDQNTVNQYFHEIGARVRPLKNKALGGTGMVHMAKLTLPLDFPKQRQIRARR